MLLFIKELIFLVEKNLIFIKEIDILLFVGIWKI